MGLHINISGADVPLKDIFSELFPSLKHLAGCIMKGQSDESEDAVQDAFLHLCDKDLAFTDMQSLKAFLYISVRNSCIDKIRRSKRHGSMTPSASSTLASESDSRDIEMDESDFIELVRKEERFRILEKSIAGLAPQSRKVMEMHIRGIPNKKIAETLSISENTVKTLKARAIETIKKSNRP